MSAVTKPVSQKPPYAAWLSAVRRERGHTNANDAMAAIERQTGVAISYGAYAAYEGGSRAPSEPHRLAIEAVFGSPPEPTTAAAPADLSDLVKAIAAQQQQIAALQEMVGELVRAIGEDRQGPPWLDDAVPAAAAYIERRVLNAIAGALTGQGPGPGAIER
jgi:hypothetical protein